LESIHDVAKVLAVENVGAPFKTKVQNPMSLPKSPKKQNVQVVLPQVVVGFLNHLQETISIQ